MKNYSLTFVVGSMMVLTFGALAQAPAAVSATQSHVSWEDLAKSNSVKVDAMKEKLDKSLKCGKRGMFYAPEGAGADAEGCMPPLVNPTTSIFINNIQGTLSKMLACSQGGMHFNAVTNSCLTAAEESAQAHGPSCRINKSNEASNCNDGIVIETESNTRNARGMRRTCITIICN